MSAVKIATSVRADQYESLERTRRRLKLRRSEAVQQALDFWLASQERDARIEQYLRGYLRHPDDPRETGAYAAAWAEGQGPEDWD